MESKSPARDPYTKCESGSCEHDLSRGILIADLLSGDNPENPNPEHPFVMLNGQRAMLLGEEHPS
jgi:hypothetical protein